MNVATQGPPGLPAGVGRRPGASRPSGPTTRTFWWAFAGIAVSAALVVGFFGRRVFLFADDYVFLYDARKVPLDLDLLRTPIFAHFSPVTQLANGIAAAQLPEHPSMIRVTLFALTVAVSAPSDSSCSACSAEPGRR